VIEEKAQVVAIDKSSIWVEARRESACSRCAANKGCGSSVFQKLFGNKTTVLPVHHSPEAGAIDVYVGDEVVIGVDESALVKNSVAVYALPVLAIIIFAAIGETFANESMSISKDLASISGALLGLIASIFALRWYNRLAGRKNSHQPLLLRRVDKPIHHAEIKILG